MSWLRALARKALPLSTRVALRRVFRETPIRLRDLGPDFVDSFRSDATIPPAARRASVGQTSSRAEFTEIGRQLANDLLTTLREAGCEPDSFRAWLDFGCGSGRVARHFHRRAATDLTGIDIDEAAIRWCRAHLVGRYDVTGSLPPTPLSDASYDLAYSVSVFTHLDEEPQRAWLREVARLVRPGGVFIASTHSPELLWSRPDATPDHRLQLEERGFLFLRGFGKFNDDSAFHSPAYLEREWSTDFELLAHKPFGLARYQDLSVWRRRSVSGGR